MKGRGNFPRELQGKEKGGGRLAVVACSHALAVDDALPLEEVFVADGAEPLDALLAALLLAPCVHFLEEALGCGFRGAAARTAGCAGPAG